MTQLSHLAEREDLLQRERCRCLRKSTDLDNDKRTTGSGYRSRSEFNRGPAMPSTSRARHRPLSHKRMVLVYSQNRRTAWCNAISPLDVANPSILSVQRMSVGIICRTRACSARTDAVDC